MSPDRDPGQRDEPSMEEYDDEEAPRSLFSALWFRAVLAVLVLGVLSALVVPYVLDSATQQTTEAPPGTPAAPPSNAAPAPVATAQPAAPATPAPAAPVSALTSTSAAPTPAPGEASTAAPPPTPRPAATAPKEKASALKEKAATAALAPARMTAKAAETQREAEKTPTIAKASLSRPTSSAATGGTGAYWVQVGAFRDAETAKRLAGHLRDAGYRVEQSTATKGAPAPAAPDGASNDRYHVVASGAPSPEVNAKLAAKGLTSESTGAGVVVQPSLPLRDAVALSRDLADAGLAVQVRRVNGTPATAPAAVTSETWYRVRVGGFLDRAAAAASMKRLEDKGYKAFIARGND